MAEKSAPAGARKAPFQLRGRRPRPPSDLEFDYKNPDMLKSFITETGKIVPRRISRLSATQQRALSTEVKRARLLALLPYVREP